MIFIMLKDKFKKGNYLNLFFENISITKNSFNNNIRYLKESIDIKYLFFTTICSLSKGVNVV